METTFEPAPTATAPVRNASRIVFPWWAGIIALAGVFTAMASWSWRKWPDVFVDFGSQLYFPWQINSGRDLYRDLEYVGGGPLSQYYHGLLFKWFDVSMTTLLSNRITGRASPCGFHPSFR